MQVSQKSIDRNPLKKDSTIKIMEPSLLIIVMIMWKESLKSRVQKH